MDVNYITYETLKRVFEKINEKEIKVYLIGGISAAIQANVDLYRKNEDLDLMINIEEQEKLLQLLKEMNYSVEDRRRNLTRNLVDDEGVFHALDHEFNADTNEDLLGIGIFTYEKKEGKIFTQSYAYHKKENRYIGYEHEMPERLFGLMYDNEEKVYHGVKVRCQTRAYTYLKKKRGTRDKDKLDAEIIERVLDRPDYEKIEEIKRLEKTVVSYLVEYDNDGNIVSRTRIPTFEEKIENYINSIKEKNSNMSDTEIKQVIAEDKYIKELIKNDNVLKEIIEIWKNSSETEDIAADARNIAHNYLNQIGFENISLAK